MKPLAEVIGESPALTEIRAQTAQLLTRRLGGRRLPPLLIQGETGTGKGLLARAIHRASARAAGPFVEVNCAAIPETLLEAELFGYERGAFTDAKHGKAGLFQVANRGTLFLDEIGLLSQALQAKLLKLLEDRTVRRLGGTQSEPVDVWILTATNENLTAAVSARRFREDLYHRLAVLSLRLPPLRERGRDVVALAQHFLTRACAEYGVPPKTLTEEARRALLTYLWPGNVRELSNVIERVVLLSEAQAVTAAALGLTETFTPGGPRPDGRPEESSGPPPGAAATERDWLLRALQATNWNVSRAAEQLGLSRNTLRYRMEKHRLRAKGVGLGPAQPEPVRVHLVSAVVGVH
jgi:two-component system response regulator AtoC